MPLCLPRRRTLAKLGLFLLAGAVVNVGVAWACDWWLPRARRGHHGYGYEMEWPMQTPSHWPAPTRRDWIGRAGKVHITYIAEGPENDWAEYGTQKSLIGWPVPSLAYRVTWEQSERTIDADQWRWVTGAVVLSRDDGLTLLPYAIHWPGFVTNLIIFGTVAGAAKGIRRGAGALRRRRGLCPRCKYAVADLPTCPECGETIRRAPASA
ncbi:MAG: hypothetical protein ACF8QF_03990 [Phycisphaerales bacterium]